MNPEALDRWITGGNPHLQLCEFECPDCGHQWQEEALVEYGGVVDAPPCPNCEEMMDVVDDPEGLPLHPPL